MIAKVTQLTLSLAATAILMTSCSKDDDDNGYKIPSTYNFENASYSGQIQRLDMLDEITSYMKTVVNGDIVDANQLKTMYANDNFIWTNTELNGSTKQLKNKTFPGESSNIEGWMEVLALASASPNVGSNGTPGIVTSGDGAKKYLFDANGMEPVQMIEKGLMGSCFYYNGITEYLSPTKMDVENDEFAEGKTYTDMQHHWDESFGYLAAPTDISDDNIADYDDLRFWGKYMKKAHDGGLNTVDNIMSAYISGRAAIDNKDYNQRDKEIANIQKEWEIIIATTAIHYLNGAISDFADDAKRNHQLSESYAFISGLKYNASKTISDSQIALVLSSLGQNFYEISVADITDAKNVLGTAFNLNVDNF